MADHDAIAAAQQALRDYSPVPLEGFMCPIEDDYHACSEERGCETLDYYLAREVVRAVASSWQINGWTVLTPAMNQARKTGGNPVIVAAQVVTEWLRCEADE